MDFPKNKKFSSHLVLTAVLTGGITIVPFPTWRERTPRSLPPRRPATSRAGADSNSFPLKKAACLVRKPPKDTATDVHLQEMQSFSLIYILLSVAAIIFNFTSCDVTSNARQFFWTLVTAAYIREGDNCADTDLGITSAHTVFVLATITLTVSVLCLVSSCVLIATIQDEGASRFLNMVVSAYVGINVASLVVDITTAAHFGMDHGTITSLMESSNMTNFSEFYVLEVVRQGAFLLMSISLKGYIGLLINWILIILLIVYVFEHRKMLKSAEHSIHKLGALKAFDQPRRPDDNNWATGSNSREPEIFSPFARGAHNNNGFNDDDSERGARRTPMRSDTNYSNRSDSWNRGQPTMAHGSRPFSYLEDIKRPAVPARPPPSPAVEPPWTRRDPWPQPQGPHVPAPDYSPTPRLKSALKPGGYM